MDTFLEKYFYKTGGNKNSDLGLDMFLKIQSAFKKFKKPAGLLHWWIFPNISKRYNTKYTQTLSENREKRNTSKLFYEVNIILIPKPGNIITGKEN